MASQIALRLCLGAVLLLRVHAQIRIISPKRTWERTHHVLGGTIEGSTATFGAPMYGDRVRGNLVYGESKGHAHCTEADYVVPNPGNHMAKIIIVRRGMCTFTTKVKIAANKGAHAVIIVDREDSALTARNMQKVVVSDDGYGGTINIPSVLISKEEGTELIKLAQTTLVEVELEWTIHMNQPVQMDLWMSSGSRDSTKFMREFAPKRKILNHIVKFHPHFAVFRMSGSGAMDMCADSTGKYCTEADGFATGKAVLEEDVRQLCIHDLYRHRDEGAASAHDAVYASMYWTYVSLFPERCPLDAEFASESHRFGKKCAESLMDEVGIDKPRVQACIYDTFEEKLSREVQNTAWSRQALRINGWRFTDKLDADVVTRMICSAFKQQPHECKVLLEKPAGANFGMFDPRSNTCSDDSDCNQDSEICEKGRFGGFKFLGSRCVPLKCETADQLLQKANREQYFWELRERDVPKEISHGNSFGKPYETVRPHLAHVVDVSDCETLGGSHRSCEMRCKPPYKPRDDEQIARIVCNRDGQLKFSAGNFGSPCVPVYNRTSVVHTFEGPVRGIRRPQGCDADCVDTYFGIPYAAPPIGRLRFRPPQKYPHWGLVFDLPEESPTGCVGWSGHVGTLTEGPGQDSKEQDPEDCLYLNVFVPQATFPHEQLPVLMHFFAGGFVGNDAWQGGTTDGAGVAKMNRAIVISPNFRLGLLGHMALHALKNSDPQRTTGNYGLQDQRAAMEWAKRSIHAFGGDPQRLHILGISSGAFAVQFHRLSPRSQGLFSGSSAHGSAQTTEWWYQPLPEADRFYREIAEEAGCPVMRQSAKKVRECLTRLSVSELHRATQKHVTLEPINSLKELVEGMAEHWASDVHDTGDLGVRGYSAEEISKMGLRRSIVANPGFPDLPCGPCVDGSDEGLPDTPRVLLANGNFTTSPALSIVQKDEGSGFNVLLAKTYPFGKVSYPLTHAGVDAIVKWLFPENSSTILGDLYSWDRIPNADTRLDNIITEGLFMCSNRFSAMQGARHNRSSTYLVDWHATFESVIKEMFGSPHAETGSFLFYYAVSHGTWPKEGEFNNNPEQLLLAVWLNCVTARLTHCGNPNTCGTLVIPSCQELEQLQGSTNIPPLTQYTETEDSRLVLRSSASAFLPTRLSSSAAWGEKQEFSNDYKQRCDFWDKVPFKFVSSFYNDRTYIRNECLKEEALAGSKQWWRCGAHQHGCDGMCCCDPGYRAEVSEDAKAVAAVNSQDPKSITRDSCTACREYRKPVNKPQGTHQKSQDDARSTDRLNAPPLFKEKEDHARAPGIAAKPAWKLKRVKVPNLRKRGKKPPPPPKHTTGPQEHMEDNDEVIV